MNDVSEERFSKVWHIIKDKKSVLEKAGQIWGSNFDKKLVSSFMSADYLNQLKLIISFFSEFERLAKFIETEKW